MMKIEYMKKDYQGCVIGVEPVNQFEIPELIETLSHKFMIENPAKTFAKRMKAGEFDGWLEDDVIVEAEIANTLADLWTMEPLVNVMMLFTRAMQMILDLKYGEKAFFPKEDPKPCEDGFEEMTTEELAEWINEAKKTKKQ